MNVTAEIERFFAENDGEFCTCPSEDFISPPEFIFASKRLIYTTRPYVLAHVASEILTPSISIAGGYGLPDVRDVERLFLATGDRSWEFIGDCDPVDFLVFAWLRIRFGETRIEYRGLSDCQLSTLDETQADRIAFAYSEPEMMAMPLVHAMLPDLTELAGPRCNSLVESRRKIELVGVVAMNGDLLAR